MQREPMSIHLHDVDNKILLHGTQYILANVGPRLPHIVECVWKRFSMPDHRTNHSSSLQECGYG